MADRVILSFFPLPIKLSIMESFNSSSIGQIKTIEHKIHGHSKLIFCKTLEVLIQGQREMHTILGVSAGRHPLNAIGTACVGVAPLGNITPMSDDGIEGMPRRLGPKQPR
jgi:hypothetical protein